MKKRYDEELAKCAFSKFLNSRSEQYTIIWETVSREFEPPDYYVNIGDVRYAVEVTGIFDKIELNGKIYTSAAISDSLDRFVNEIEKKAKSRGILTGGYVVGFSPISNFPARRDELQLKILEYIKRTRNMIKAELEKIADCGFEQIDIIKLEDTEIGIEKVISFTPKWEGESIEELRTAFDNVLRDKTRKLSKINDPIILLLLDSFNYLRGKHWRDIIRQLKPVGGFHSICRVSAQGKACILKSDEKTWEL